MTVQSADGAKGSAFDDAGFSTRLITFIASEVAMSDDEIVADTDLLLTGLVDSLGVVMIVDWIENDVGVTIDPADVVLENFQTVAAMVAYVGTR